MQEVPPVLILGFFQQSQEKMQKSSAAAHTFQADSHHRFSQTPQRNRTSYYLIQLVLLIRLMILCIINNYIIKLTMFQHDQQTNPFGEPSLNSEQQFYCEDSEPYPICLDNQNKHVQSRNTPISRFSQSNPSQHSQSKGADTEIEDMAHHLNQVVQQDRMTKITMTAEQLSKIYNLHEAYADAKCHTQVLEKRNQEMAIQLERQRVKTNHFEKALTLIKEQDHSILKQLTQKTEKMLELQEKLNIERQKNEEQNQQLARSKAENSYLKQLIVIANKNYEKMEDKYEALRKQKEQIITLNQEREKETNATIQNMKDVFLQLMVQIQGKSVQQQPPKNAKNKSNMLAHNKSSHTTAYNSNNEKHQILASLNHAKDKENNKENKRMEHGTLKTDKNAPKQNEQIFRNFFLQTLKTNK